MKNRFAKNYFWLCWTVVMAFTSVFHLLMPAWLSASAGWTYSPYWQAQLGYFSLGAALFSGLALMGLVDSVPRSIVGAASLFVGMLSYHHFSFWKVDGNQMHGIFCIAYAITAALGLISLVTESMRPSRPTIPREWRI